jgi:hypothetical protein
MTTTTDRHIRIITALRDQARSTNHEAEAATFMEKARSLCEKHGIDTAILDAPRTETKRTVINGQATQTEKKYSCRFGCGLFVQHTIDELNACAAKARDRGNGNAYNDPTRKQRDPFEDLFGSAWKNAGSTSSDSGFRAGAPKARATGTHAYCSHEATKSARAKCRRERGY